MPATRRFSASARAAIAPKRRTRAAEWERIAAAFAAVAAMEGVRLVAPSDALTVAADHAGESLRLESAAYPVPVKKQRKYNLTRWAVTGRDDIAVNAACQRIYAALKNAMRPMRTGGNCAGSGPAIFAPISPKHAGRITARDLAAMEARLGTARQPAALARAGEAVTDRLSTSSRLSSAPGWTAGAAWPSSMPASRRILRP